jgi:transposase
MHKMELLSRESLAAVWHKPVREIAQQFGISRSAVYNWGNKWGMRRSEKQFSPHHPDPSEEEIEQRAAEVRKSWSPSEARRRLVGVAKKTSRWTPPVIETGEIEAPVFSRI